MGLATSVSKLLDTNAFIQQLLLHPRKASG